MRSPTYISYIHFSLAGLGEELSNLDFSASKTQENYPGHQTINPSKKQVSSTAKKRCCHLINNTRYQYIKYFNKLSWSCLFKVLTLANHRASQGDGLWRRSLSRSLEIGGNSRNQRAWQRACNLQASSFIYLLLEWHWGQGSILGLHPFAMFLCFLLFFFREQNKASGNTSFRLQTSSIFPYISIRCGSSFGFRTLKSSVFVD